MDWGNTEKLVQSLEDPVTLLSRMLLFRYKSSALVCEYGHGFVFLRAKCVDVPVKICFQK